MIRIWVDKYYFRSNLAIENRIKKFITISVSYYNFGCRLSTKIVITEIVFFFSILVDFFENDESCETLLVNDQNLGW